MSYFKTNLSVITILLLFFSPVLISEEVAEQNTRPLDGELLLPDGYNTQSKEKKCITVCDQWGEDCIINPSSNSGARKCRRVCKSFAETCF